MQELLLKITNTILIVMIFSFSGAVISAIAADASSVTSDGLADILFGVFGVLFLLSLAALPVVAIVYIWS